VLAAALGVATAAGLEPGLAGSAAVAPARALASTPAAQRQQLGHRIRAHPGAILPGSTVRAADLFTHRAFANATTGFALANDGPAQYPVRTTDAGRDWRIDGPQLHIDAADGAEGVGYAARPGRGRTLAYGGSIVDATTDAGRTWWETYLGELVVAVVPAAGNRLVAYVQQQLSNSSIRSAATWQYVSSDGGRHWRYTTALLALES
jgi:hypothetical protein